MSETRGGRMTTVEQAVTQEQERRRGLRDRRQPYHHWRERGDDRPPPFEYWCEFCVGFYGVPHNNAHPKGGCRSRGRVPRQCACIECVVTEQLRRAGETPVVYS